MGQGLLHHLLGFFAGQAVVRVRGLVFQSVTQRHRIFLFPETGVNGLGQPVLAAAAKMVYKKVAGEGGGQVVNAPLSTL